MNRYSDTIQSFYDFRKAFGCHRDVRRVFKPQRHPDRAALGLTEGYSNRAKTQSQIWRHGAVGVVKELPEENILRFAQWSTVYQLYSSASWRNDEPEPEAQLIHHHLTVY
ncbi:hypothetical protein Q7C36_020352 [Tachysurus vachellii]|uniref:Uncharacterized protein n=1 Tax=Tachysurus vachellii TaxID=175792 RepID=A0AA88LTG4_TACVA|nr:hypothetical protein Q7C36_020352 [Tachysurus vachellii]